MNQFLPVTKADLAERGWEEFDFLVITGDAYVDHPSFGPAIISRVLEAEGYRVAILAQPDWRKAGSFTALGRPRLGVLLSSGNIDSMVAHYTVAKKRRHDDAYSPGNRAGLRPDRAVIVYANKVREAFGDIPLVIGGLEASLRRFAHYDYWEDKVRRAILFDSQADLLVYGMGERATREIAARLASGTPIREITDVKGTAFIAKDPSACAYPKVECPSFEAVSTDKRAYAQANQIQYEEHDPVRGKAILQRHGAKWLIVNPPSMPLSTKELDAVAELPADGSVILLDVRTPGEVRKQGLLRSDALHIPLDELRGRLGELDKGKKIYVNCYSGLRSYLACRILSQHGFQCSNLSGGWRFWSYNATDRAHDAAPTHLCGVPTGKD